MATISDKMIKQLKALAELEMVDENDEEIDIIECASMNGQIQLARDVLKEIS